MFGHYIGQIDTCKIWSRFSVCFMYKSKGTRETDRGIML